MTTLLVLCPLVGQQPHAEAPAWSYDLPRGSAAAARTSLKGTGVRSPLEVIKWHTLGARERGEKAQRVGVERLLARLNSTRVLSATQRTAGSLTLVLRQGAEQGSALL